MTRPTGHTRRAVNGDFRMGGTEVRRGGIDHASIPPHRFATILLVHKSKPKNTLKTLQNRCIWFECQNNGEILRQAGAELCQAKAKLC